jgi:prevent-host-death family protein
MDLLVPASQIIASDNYGMSQEITQRELRNNSGEIMRELDEGHSFVVTRNGTAVAELIPLRRNTFVSSRRVAAAFSDAPAIDVEKFRSNVDEFVDQRVETTFDPLPFDTRAAQTCGRVYAAAAAYGRKPRSRLADLLIASVASANSLPLYTRNPHDFEGLEEIVEVVSI